MALLQSKYSKSVDIIAFGNYCIQITKRLLELVLNLFISLYLDVYQELKIRLLYRLNINI